MSQDKTARIVILGCGRVGARLAIALDAKGNKVTVIDRSADAFRRLAEGFGGESILGIGIDREVLEKAGIEQADIFIAVTERDATNIMASQIAKLIYRVNKVITRIYDPDREEIFRATGLETTCPTTVSAKTLYDMLVKSSKVGASTVAGAR